jgi:CxxC motif-containing protein (DUF1111 family)
MKIMRITDRRRRRRRFAALTLLAPLAAAGSASAGVGDPLTQPAMGDPLHGLSAAELERFLLGRQAFSTPLLEAEGLGPVFNKESCGNCHSGPVGGPGSQTVTRFGAAGKKGFDPLAEWGGSLLQVASIDEACREVVPAGANVVAQRVTNGMMGYGLVEAVPDKSILDVMKRQPKAMRGVAHMVVPLETPGGALRVGRFGWKAQVATVLSFSGDASLNEMGLTNRLVSRENDPNGVHPPALSECDSVPENPYEDGVHLGDGASREFIDVVTDFQRFLAPPPQTPRSGMRGEKIFGAIGCAVCHHPGFATPDDPALEDALRRKPVRLYSDFLLHNMGLAADFIHQGGPASETMMKTAPLAGIRFRDPVWHDGAVAAGTFESRMRGAIALHGVPGSSAAPSAASFDRLSGAEQAAVIDFLRSLGRREFDVEEPVSEQLDNQIDLFDFAGFGAPAAFAPCFGPGPYGPDDPCAIHDVDQDGEVDWEDFVAFLSVYQGPRADCNGNGVMDLVEILDGTQVDDDGDGVLDACQGCPADLDGDGVVGIADLIQVIVGWGPCSEECPADVNQSGVVDVADLLAVINAWGRCLDLGPDT